MRALRASFVIVFAASVFCFTLWGHWAFLMTASIALTARLFLPFDQPSEETPQPLPDEDDWKIIYKLEPRAREGGRDERSEQ